MATESHTRRELAEALYGLMPRAIPQAQLDEYGIEATDEQVRQITREVLSLNLFWIYTALSTLLSPPDRDGVLAELIQVIHQAWERDFGLDRGEIEEYFRELDARRVAYHRVVREGGSPLSVYGEAASLLESNRVVSAEDERRLVGLLLDVIPVDGYGELLEDVELRDG